MHNTTHAMRFGLAWLFCLVGIPTGSYGQQHQADSAKKFDAMVKSVHGKKITREPKPIRKKGSAYIYNVFTELHIEFLFGPSQVINNVDAVSIFPVKVSGFKKVHDTRVSSKPKITRGNDTEFVRLTVKDLLADNAKPKATIRDFKVDHGTEFEVEQMIRDEIIEAVRWYLPHVEVEGRQKFWQKKLRIENQTNDKMYVFVYYRSKRQTQEGNQWSWLPTKPGGGKPVKIVVPPKSQKLVVGQPVQYVNLPFGFKSVNVNLQQRKLPIETWKVRIWAESENGERWERYRRKDLELIPPNSKYENQRVYHDQTMQTHTYAFKPKSRQRTFSERMLVLRNNTREELVVDLAYFSRIGGESRWRKLPSMKIPPQTIVGPTDEFGMRVRASKIRFKAEGKSFLYTKFYNNSLYLVKESEAGRVYQARKIGQFEHVFEKIDKDD